MKRFGGTSITGKMVKGLQLGLPLGMSALCMTSCFAPAEEDVAAVEDARATLHVTTRSATGVLEYPVMILAYSDAGSLCGQQTLTSEADDIRLQLSEGIYHITAMAGYDAYAMPKSLEQKSATIGMPASGYAAAPLMMGGADIMLGSSNASVSLTLSYRVASVTLALSDVPEGVTAVSVGVSQQYGAMDMGGSLSGTATANVPCTLTDGVWTSETFYVLPGSGSTTTLTLSLTDADGQVSYGYELGEALQAAVPYVISGTYVESTAPYITGVLTMEGWQEERAVSFDFGSGVSHSSGGTVVEVPTFKVDAIPEPCSLWDGHVVALVDNATDSSADLLLLARDEYTDIYSPKAQGHEADMQAKAANYDEEGLRGWSVPTEAQARALRKEYAGEYEALNAVIGDGAPIAEYTSGNNNARFLCEQGTKTFNWAKSGSITTAGTSVRYRLRLVKVVHVETK